MFQLKSNKYLNYIIKSLNVNEIIIDFVRENQCLYDKCDVDFKNVSKKKICGKKYSQI